MASHSWTLWVSLLEWIISISNVAKSSPLNWHLKKKVNVSDMTYVL
uniref:Uncharacterized protein n=1 Tax=Anguilla anguilla TaxID=7936 RepID=A0A0E9VHF3_ANGAN